MKPNPISSICRATSSGSSPISTPSASSRSAEPERLVFERLPCLATAQPAPAATRAAVVETLKVEGPPPVPAVSTRSSRVQLDRSRKRAHGAGQADQLGHGLALGPQGDQEGAGLDLAGATLHDLAEHGRSVVGGQVVARGDRVDRPGQDRHSAFPPPDAASRVEPEEGGDHLLAAGGQYRLGVELDSFGRQFAVPDPHDDVTVGGADLELVGQRVAGDQRVVAADRQRRRQAFVDRLAVVLDLRLLAVDRLALDDRAAEGLDQRLVAEADPEHRDALAGELRGSPRPRSRPRRACRVPGETTTRS